MTEWAIEKLQLQLQEQIELSDERFAHLCVALKDLSTEQRRTADELTRVRLRLEGWTSRLNGAWTIFLILSGGFGAGLGLLVHWFKR